MKIIPLAIRHGKMFLRHQAENFSLLTKIREVRKMTPQLKGDLSLLSVFLQNKIHETIYKNIIHENYFYEILFLFSKRFSIIQVFTALCVINTIEMAAFSILGSF